MNFQAVKVLVLTVLTSGIVCPPVTTPKADVKETEDAQFGLEYERYLREIVSILETDDQFRNKLEQANISDIKSGDIAQHLEFVSHGIRTKLDEIKRREVDRLNQIKKLLVAKQTGKTGRLPGMPNLPAQVVDAVLKQQGIHPDTDHNKLTQHIDHKNPETFEVDDLKKLIQKATNDLEALDIERKAEFKNYELEKEHLRREKLRQLDERSRTEEQKRFEEMQKKHKEHPKLHHPGNKAQLEEVWEKDDEMDPDDFDPRTMFFLHDKNGDKVLDEPEVEALFLRELDKAYDPNAPEDDLVEREEEMNRMREHVFKEVDKDGDRLINLQEFLDSTRDEAFDADETWETMNEEEQFTDEELAQYEREHEERRRQMFEGNIQPGEINIPPQGSPIPDLNHQQQQQQQEQGGGVQHMQQRGGQVPAHMKLPQYDPRSDPMSNQFQAHAPGAQFQDRGHAPSSHGQNQDHGLVGQVPGQFPNQGHFQEQRKFQGQPQFQGQGQFKASLPQFQGDNLKFQGQDPDQRAEVKVGVQTQRHRDSKGQGLDNLKFVQQHMDGVKGEGDGDRMGKNINVPQQEVPKY